MNEQEFVIQDASTGYVSTVLEAIGEVARQTTFSAARVSVAFASKKGCECLNTRLASVANSWAGSNKRWLVSIDFGQTSPDALAFLQALPNSAVRIPDGSTLLESNLIPLRSFHPKTYVFTGKLNKESPEIGIVSGSANLTYGALNTNAEHVFAHRRWGAAAKGDENITGATDNFGAWWELAWEKATPFNKAFLKQYQKLYTPNKQLQDAEDLSKSFSSATNSVVDVSQGAKWATSRFFWIEAGTLYKNRGPKQAGNQLDCRRGTRVYFGFPPDAVETNTVLGQIQITYVGNQPQQRSVKFADNAMDKVNLPVPGEYGPETYDGSVLLFERTGNKQFLLKMASPAAAKPWISKSKQIDLYYQLGGAGRQFGFFS